MEIKLSDIIVPAFHDFWRAFKSNLYTFFIMKGGRNSSKSTTASIGCIMDLVEYPINILVIRKIGKDLEKSVYEQLKKAAIFLGIENEFTFRKSPLGITYKARGNEIIFRGADDSTKIKSITTARFPIALVWFEELDQFKTEDEVQTIIDSILREKLPDNLRYKVIYTYNPPKRKQNWVNKKFETQFLPKNVFVHHSDYRCNPHLAEQTIQDIEQTKFDNIRKYNWNYLGMPTGGGIVPFENLVFRPITDEEIKSFSNARQGLDWGYATHPFSFGRFEYNKNKSGLYLFDEVFGLQLSNRETYERIRAKGYADTLTTADSAEPKSVKDMHDRGMKIKGAIKGPGSVEYGEKWLNDLTEIVIDPVRCPGAAKQFEDIDYKVDRDGNLKAELEDLENDSIDMTRYACEADMGRSSIRFLKAS